MSPNDIRITCPLLILHPSPPTVLATYISISIFNLLLTTLLFLPLVISLLKSSSPYLAPTSTPRLHRLSNFLLRHRSARCFIWFLHIFCLLTLIVQAFVLHAGYICGNGGLLNLPMKHERPFYGWSPAGGWVVYIVQVLMVLASALSLWKLLRSALREARGERLQVQLEELDKKGKEKEGEDKLVGKGVRRVLAHHEAGPQSGITTDTTTTAINSPLPTRPHTPAYSSTTAASSRRRLDWLVWEGIETITAGPSLHLDPRGGRLPDPGFKHAIARRNLARRSGTTTPAALPSRPRTPNGNGEGSSRAVQRLRDAPPAVDEQGFPFPRMPPPSLPPRCQSRAGRRGEGGVYIPLSGAPRALDGRRRAMLRQIAPMPITSFSVPVARSSINGNGNGKGKAPCFAPTQPSPLRFGGGFETAPCTGGSHVSELASPQRQDEGEAVPTANHTAPAPESFATVNVNGSCRLDRLIPRKQTEDVVFELATMEKPTSETAQAEAEAETGKQGTLSRASSLGQSEREREAVKMGMPPLERCPKRVPTLWSPDSGVALDEMV
ncbi:hypothetical protein G7Y79_00060g092110 [Physcia stellaris]|nr:hypothetical protein G7Y79_00060g092110 [Physcia stellaris]